MNMTQQEFADMLGISQGNVGHYELRDQVMPPHVARFLIMKAADRGHWVTYEDIYGKVHAPVMMPPRSRRERLEITERRFRNAED